MAFDNNQPHVNSYVEEDSLVTTGVLNDLVTLTNSSTYSFALDTVLPEIYHDEDMKFHRSVKNTSLPAIQVMALFVRFNQCRQPDVLGIDAQPLSPIFPFGERSSIGLQHRDIPVELTACR